MYKYDYIDKIHRPINGGIVLVLTVVVVIGVVEDSRRRLTRVTT